MPQLESDFFPKVSLGLVERLPLPVLSSIIGGLIGQNAETAIWSGVAVAAIQEFAIRVVSAIMNRTNEITDPTG